MKITVTKLLSWCPENAVADQGKGRGGSGHPFDFRPNWGPKGRKKFFRGPPTRYLWVSMTRAPLIWKSGYATGCTVTTVHCEQTSQSVIKCLWYGWDWIFDHGKILLIKHLVYHFSGHYLYFPDFLRIRDVFCQTGNHFFVLAISWMTLLEWKVWSFS